MLGSSVNGESGYSIETLSEFIKFKTLGARMPRFDKSDILSLSIKKNLLKNEIDPS